MSSCLFCQIANKKIPSEIIFENKRIIAFKDIDPKAPVHILIIPKKHITSVNHLKSKDKGLVGELFLVAQKITKKKKLIKRGYRLVINKGKNAGQTIEHLHLHLLGGKKLPFA